MPINEFEPRLKHSWSDLPFSMPGRDAGGHPIRVFTRHPEKILGRRPETAEELIQAVKVDLDRQERISNPDSTQLADESKEDSSPTKPNTDVEETLPVAFVPDEDISSN